MTCTILLVTLMVSTVSFIYGTQSDSVLKDVLSATGDDLQLRKSRDGNKKYGSFREVLVPESMRRTKKHDGPLPPPKPRIEPCTDIYEACALVRQIDNEELSLCHCQELTGTDCKENWHNSDAWVTFKDPEDGELTRLKFCNGIKLDECTTGMTAGTLDRTVTTGSTERWVYEPTCNCHNTHTEVEKLEPIGHNTWRRSLVCGKPSCPSGENCVKRFTELHNMQYTSTFEYFCACPPGKKCPDPERHVNLESDSEGGGYTSATYSKCT